MSHRALQMRLGIGAILAAAFLLTYAIPNWVSSPSNVRNIVLSPLFWPYILGGLTGLMGLALCCRAGARRRGAGQRGDRAIRARGRCGSWRSRC